MYAIETKDLCKSYKSLKAVNKLNLTVNEGELFSLLGVNGAGKTTTIKILCGLTKESGGEAFICGKSIDTNRDEIKKIINVSPQETAVAPNLTVRENLELIAGIYGYTGDSLVKRVEEVTEQFSLEEVMSQRAKTLSGGWQRRLSIAMAIISEPKVLFLDEPTLGLDVLARRELWRVIKDLKGSVTIVLTTHYMEEAQELSDRIGIMAKGKLLTVDTPQNLMEKTSSQNIEEAFVKIAEGDVK
ncbi:MAG: ABC transporter ATP-binding protein [Oscillospiraceae bacterium]|nr:ABC transporter ATP-binding protein [Oscillospiraceae bacterium]